MGDEIIDLTIISSSSEEAMPQAPVPLYSVDAKAKAAKGEVKAGPSGSRSEKRKKPANSGGGTGEAGPSTTPKQTKGSPKPTKISALLYCGVGAKDLDKDNLDCKSVYDVISSIPDISLVYTRLTTGDGMWRLWPVIERSSGSSNDKTAIISQLSYPSKEFDSTARFTADKSDRQSLLNASKERKSVKIKIYLFMLKGADYQCCFPHAIYFLNRIELDLTKEESEKVPQAVHELTEYQQLLQQSTEAHQELLGKIRTLFKELAHDDDSIAEKLAMENALKGYNDMDPILKEGREPDREDNEMEKADLERAGMERRTSIEKARRLMENGEVPSVNDNAPTVDENRKKLEDEDEENKYWASGFRLAVHEGARRLIVEVVDSKRLIEECIVDLFRTDKVRVDRILKSFGADAIKLGVSSNHLKGEALELLYCYYNLVQKSGVIRDYLEEDKNEYSAETALHKDYEVLSVFMSSAPCGSPFRMKESDRDRIAKDLQGNKEAAKSFADRLYHFSRKDRFFDVLVEVKEVKGRKSKTAAGLEANDDDDDNDNDVDSMEEDEAPAAPSGSLKAKEVKDGKFKTHFIAAQCKVRSERKAYIDLAKYVGHLALCRHSARKLGCLIRLDWVSNVYKCRQADGDMKEYTEDGHVDLFLFYTMCSEATTLFAAAEEAKKRFGSPDELKIKATPNKTPRPFQKEALKALFNARNGKEGVEKVRGGTVIAATGSGKSITAFIDALNTLEELNNDLPMLWTCPTIFLLTQSALAFSQWEKIHNKNNDIAGPRYIYLVCSADDITAPALRVIKNSEVLSTMLMHYRDGNLGCCRFFSTVEGSGGLWDVINKFIRLTRGTTADLQKAVFGPYIGDEVHKQCGTNSLSYSLGLNIPSKWFVGYTATPAAEKTRASAIKAAQKAERVPVETDPATDSDEQPGDRDEEEQHLDILLDGAVEEEDQETESDDGDSDGDSREGPVTKRAKYLQEQKPQDIFGKFYDSNLSPNLLGNDPALKQASMNGLKGLQLLSKNMQFTSLEYLAEKSENESEKFLAEQILKAWNERKSNDGIRAHLLKLQNSNQTVPMESKISQIVVFPVEPELTLGACTCGKSKRKKETKETAEETTVTADASHKYNCAYSVCLARKEKEEGAMSHLFRAKYDSSATNYVPEEFCGGDSSTIIGPDCLVLGIHRKDETITLSLRKGPARGVAVHDCTEFGMYDANFPDRKATNLIGKALYTYTFAEAFAEKDPILAKPALAVYSLDPLAIPLAAEKHIALERVQSWLGISEKRTPGDSLDDGIIIKSLNKVKLQITFDGDATLYATVQEYASANLLLRLFEEGHVRKPIVFCPNASSCRRLMALFMAMRRRRVQDLKDNNESLADDLRSVVCGHVYQSETKGGEVVAEQPLHVRGQLIGEYLTSKFAVLFNTNLLSTGIDFPCCDGVLLTSPTKDPKAIMQRWGRSLRYVQCRPDKKGYLALVSTDPHESAKHAKDVKKELGIDKTKVIKNGQATTEAEFDVMYRVAECAVDRSSGPIGRVFSLIKEWTIAAKLSGSWGKDNKLTKRKSIAEILLMTKKPSEAVISLTPEHEKVLTDIFKTHTVNLQQRLLPWSVRYDAAEIAMRESGVWLDNGEPLVFRGRGTGVPEEETSIFTRRYSLLQSKEWSPECKEFDDRFPANEFKAKWDKEKARIVSGLGKIEDKWDENYDAYSELIKRKEKLSRYPAGKTPSRKLTDEENQERDLYTWHSHIYDAINLEGSVKEYRKKYPRRAERLDKADWWTWQKEDRDNEEYKIFKSNAADCDEYVRNKRRPRKNPAGRQKIRLNEEEREEARLGSWLGNVNKGIKECGGEQGYKSKYPERFDILSAFGWFSWDRDATKMEEFKGKLEEMDKFWDENPHKRRSRLPLGRPTELRDDKLSAGEKEKYIQEQRLREWYGRELRTNVNSLGKTKYTEDFRERAALLEERESTWWRWEIDQDEEFFNNNINTVCDWYEANRRVPSRSAGGKKKRAGELQEEEKAERNAGEALRRLVDKVKKDYASEEQFRSKYPEVAEQLDAGAAEVPWWDWAKVTWNGRSAEAGIGEEASEN